MHAHCTQRTAAGGLILIVCAGALPGAEPPGPSLLAVGTDKARYPPSGQVTFRAEWAGPTSVEGQVQVEFVVRQLDREVARVRMAEAAVRGGFSAAATWIAPPEDYQGYLVEARLMLDGKTVDQRNTAVDVSSDWTRFPRYGYVADFGPMPPERIRERVARLNAFHLDGLLFYDWQHKHHRPLAGTLGQPASEWPDIANRTNVFSTVAGYVRAARERNMVAMNYNLIYGAWPSAYREGAEREWGLFRDRNGDDQDDHRLPDSWATSRILIMNPGDPGWQDYLIGEESKAFGVFGFDGWHVDQVFLGGPRYRFDGQPVDLPASFVSFLTKAKAELKTRLVMNAVNQFGQPELARSAPVDFLYTEAWPPQSATYGKLKGIVEANWKASAGTKNTVLAAYMNSALAGQPGWFNTPSVLMADAVLFAAGGAHLELGDLGMLAKEYFPNDHLKVSAELADRLGDYYDFLVAYQNWLRDAGVTPVERDAIAEGVELSRVDRPGAVWYFARRRGPDEILHLLNLTSQPSSEWRDDYGRYPESRTLSGLNVTYFTDAPVETLLAASPDRNHGSPEQLSFTTGKKDGRSFVRFVVPSLKYWDMILLLGPRR
ncbi:MAG: glycoside hydrolase family 66 protein [Verrucomicrobiota bacterium]